MPSLRCIITLSLAPLLVFAQSQTFLPTAASGNFPACATGCAVLEQAQTTCLSQTGQQTTGLAAENCFCQSATVQGLYSSPDSLCVAECPNESDRVNLRTWFMSFCAQVGKGVDPNAQTSAATTSLVTSTNAAPAPTAIDGTAVVPESQSKGNQSWISGHWQWIVMVVVLAIGLGALAWLLTFLKKRHRRKVNERRAQLGGFPTEREKAAGATAATPELWGPHQHMHATQGWEYGDMAVGAVPRDRTDRADRGGRNERKRSKRRSLKPGSKATDAVTGVSEVRPPASRGQSSKGNRAINSDAIEVQRDPSHSRSRTRKPRGSRFDFDRDVENQ